MRNPTEEALFDPFSINSFLQFVDTYRFKVTPQIRERAFNNMLKNEEYFREGDVFYMKGSDVNKAEEQTAIKLGKAGYYVVFPGKGQKKQIKKLENDKTLCNNDAYIYNKETFYQQKTDIKAVNGGSIEAIKEHISQGSKQAPVVVIDMPATTSRWNVINGIRLGWDKDNTKTILLNWKGRWYNIDKNRAFGKKKENKNWLENSIQ